MHRNRSFSNILHFSSPAAMSVVRTVARLRCALCRLARASLSPCLLTIAACGPFCTVFELPQFAATRDQDVLPRRHHTEDATHTHGLLAMSEARGRLWAPSAKSAPSAHHVLVSTPTPQTECQLRVACITSSPRTRWLGSQRRWSSPRHKTCPRNCFARCNLDFSRYWKCRTDFRNLLFFLMQNWWQTQRGFGTCTSGDQVSFEWHP